ncbi:hypothetical protein VM1G_05122 [Cytospora mali]|uniref:Uncharacterized protein n=1 Tax=Cytospora mali TaxID=578113 RepID=A0A194W1Z8_CYTMA|nr:hypothetical protein VM1G_05122 [Valsa mali]
MAAAFVTSTPAPGSPASINTPPTPRLGGFADNWEPYTPVRKSARLSSRSAANRTPSPHQSGRTSQSHQLRASPRSTPHKHQPTSKSTSTSTSTSKMTSSPATTSPQKKRLAPPDNRRASSSLTAESIRNAAAALGQSQKMDSHTTASSSQAALALPTPAKTPAHKHSTQSEKNVNAIARNLFSKQQSPKKTRTKQYKLVSFETEAETETFQIYTDSQDRVPEPDAADDNPFYGEAGIAASARPVRRSSRNRKSATGDSISDVLDEVVKREDGLLYVFRGKKIFRKFTDGEGSSRPQVKPRLLFPSAKNNENDLLHPDEEAETDIEEEPVKQKVDTKDEVETPAEAIEEKADTPKAPKFAPVSPPATSRATRSKKIIADEPTPVKAKRPGNRSPFDGWKRTKTASQSSAHGQKRAGETLSGASASKRTRV